MSEQEILLDVLKRVLDPDKYKNIRFYKEGGSRACFIADWGLGKEQRIIKIDKSNITNPRAIRYTERGYTTANDIVALSQIEDPEQHHLARLCDYFKLDEEGLAISVESLFKAPSLTEIVEKEGPLATKDFESVITQFLEAERYLMGDLGMLHRDAKADNILVKKNGSIDVRLSDFANACKKENITSKLFPTAGSKSFTDPLIQGVFTGKESGYRETSEFYSVGINMLYGLTGKLPFEYDPDKKIAKVVSTGENLLDEHGLLNRKRHNEVLEQILSALPNGSRKYASVIRKCLTLDESQRYTSIDDLIKDFDKKKSSGKRNKMWLLGIGAAALLSIFGAGVWYTAQKQSENTSNNLSSANRYNVQVSWNTSNNDIQNNLVDMQLHAYISGRNPPKNNYDSAGAKDIFGVSKDRFIRAENNDKISLSAVVKEIVDTGSYYSLDGKAYFEGFEGIPFKVVPSRPNEVDDGDEGSNIGVGNLDITVPDELREGLYYLVVELYPPEKPEQTWGEGYKKIGFPSSDRIITRKKIPVVIGNPTYKIDLERANISYTEYVSMKNLDENHIEDVVFEASVPETGYVHTGSNNWFSLNIPKPTNREERTIQLVARHKGQPIWHTFIPIKGKSLDGEDPTWYELGNPTKKFSERIIDYRKQIYTNSHNQAR